MEREVELLDKLNALQVTVEESSDIINACGCHAELRRKEGA